MNKLREASKKRKDYNEYLTNEFLIQTALDELSITGDSKEFIVDLVKDLNHALATERDIKQSYNTKFEELKFDLGNAHAEIEKLNRNMKELKEDYEGLELTQKLTLKVVHDKQEEIESLKGDMAMWKASYDDDIREARAEGIDELKEEIESLKKDKQAEDQDYP